jgi:type IV fimbrial biogenesis protein FimT
MNQSNTTLQLSLSGAETATVWRRARGFTLIELVITVAILGVLALWAVPNLQQFIQNARMTSLANELVADIGVARQEALRRGVAVVICASADKQTCLTGSDKNWMDGWVIRQDSAPTPLIKASTDLSIGSGTKKVKGDGPAQITFSARGTASSEGATPAELTIALRDNRSGSGEKSQRNVTVTLVGRPSITKVPG